LFDGEITNLRRAIFVCGQQVVDGNSDKAELTPLLQNGPIELWSKTLTPIIAFTDVGVHKSNGIKLTPDGASSAVITTRGAEIYAIDPYTGAGKWSYRPSPAKTTPTPTIIRCQSSASFSSSSSSQFLVYTVIDDQASGDIDDTVSRVVALDWETGEELWISEFLDGVAQGDPLISSDGRYVFVTHNTARETQGFFSILSTHETPGQDPGKSLYSDFTGSVGQDSVAFGPPAIFHNPTRGNYDPYDGGYGGNPAISQGDDNNNDFVMWGQTPKPADYRSKEIQDGHIYGFQFPRDFDSNNVTAASASMKNYDVTFFQLGRQIRDFQVTTPPVITNGGLSAYWGVSRSGFCGWTSKKVSRERNAVEGFTRNSDFPGQPVFATPALSHGSDSQPYLFGGTSSNEFVRLNYDLAEVVVIKTKSLIKSRAIVDVNDRVVYYVEEDGTLHQADFNVLTDVWSYDTLASSPSSSGGDVSVQGDIALTPAGNLLLVADTSGNVKALQVAEMSSAATVGGGATNADMSREGTTGSRMRSMLRA
jgi:outer membrane protein assembly factor BamB